MTVTHLHPDDTRRTVLVVDDTADNLTLLSDLLKDAYRVKVANSGEKALRIIASGNPPDIVLLDIMMPGMDGYEVLRRLKGLPGTADVPVIFLTALSEEDDERIGLELGAVDYITKPVSAPIMLARVRTHLQMKAARDFLKDKNEFLEDEVARRMRELAAVQDVTIMCMASLAETRDNETGNHIRRTQHYVRVLAQHLSPHPRFAAALSSDEIPLLFKSAPLHDIGKVGIADRILLKPGKLTPEEFEDMKRHPALGRDAIMAAERQLDTPVSFLRHAREIAYCHHEKWDGTGYPQGLSGDAIPVSARLMALADVFDALISRRVYKPPFDMEKSVGIIREGRGTHFDPDVVDAFLANLPTFRGIADRYADSEETLAETRARTEKDYPLTVSQG